MQQNVPVGPTTVAGYAATIVGALAAVLALALPNVPQQQTALIASGVFALGSLVVTQVGRYLQAHDQAKPGAIMAKTYAVQRADAATLAKTSGVLDDDLAAITLADETLGPQAAKVAIAHPKPATSHV